MVRGYQAVLNLFGPAAAQALSLNKKYSASIAERKVKGDWSAVSPSQKTRVWFHVASVGEFIGIEPVLAKLNDEYDIFLTTTSETGKAAAIKKGFSSCLLPLDYPGPVRAAFERAKPDLLVISETELWPCLLFEANSQEVPVLIVNGRISDYTANRYANLSFFFKKLLRVPQTVLVQTALDKTRYETIGADPDKVIVSGSSKYDQAAKEYSDSEKQEFLKELGLDSSKPIFIAGSVRPKEDEAVVDAYIAAAKRQSDLQLIIAPRHPEEFEKVYELLLSKGLELNRRSDGAASKQRQVFLLDTLGELNKAYSVSDVAYVGASLVDIGGHNPLEPAAFSVPVIMGPYTNTVRDAVKDLKSAGGLFEVTSSVELADKLQELYSDKEALEVAASAAKKVWSSHQGASEKIVGHIQDALDSPETGLLEVEAVPFSTFLSPFFGIGVWVRNKLYDLEVLKAKASSLPVISVGNITVGGSGKTPFAAALCQFLLEQGKCPVLLSRGYGGSEAGPVLVNDKSRAQSVGDEALMQQREFNGLVPVVVSRKRVEGAQFIEEQGLGNVIVLDDGFQHRALKRDLDLALLDLSEPGFMGRLEDENLLPLGRFREKPSSGLNRADKIIFLERDWTENADIGDCEKALRISGIMTGIDRAILSFAGFYALGKDRELVSLKDKKVSMFTAIARAGQFKKLLTAQGVKVGDEKILADHSNWTKAQWDEIYRSLPKPIVVTEKDACKIPLEESENIFVAKLEVYFTDSLARSIMSIFGSNVLSPNLRQNIA